jgi:hypothetical protein
MLKRAGVIAGLLLLAGCSHTTIETAKDIHMAAFAPRRPAEVNASTIEAWMKNPTCNYSQYPINQGQYMPLTCINAWALNLAHIVYQQGEDQLPLYLTQDGVHSLALLRQSIDFQSALTGKVTFIGQPLYVNQGIPAGYDRYTWVVKIPVLITSPKTNTRPEMQSAQFLVIEFERNHQSSSNGLQATNFHLRLIGLTELAQYQVQAKSPYLPVKELYANSYAKPLFFDNPVPAQVTIYKGKQQLFSGNLPAGPQDVGTDSFPSGSYQVTIKMSGANGQFLREYSQQIQKE